MPEERPAPGVRFWNMDETRHPRRLPPRSRDDRCQHLGGRQVRHCSGSRRALVSVALLWGLLKYFQSQEATSVAITIEPTKLFPQPQLQKTPILDLRAIRAEEDKILNTLRLGRSTQRRRAHPRIAGHRNPGRPRTAGAQPRLRQPKRYPNNEINVLGGAGLSLPTGTRSSDSSRLITLRFLCVRSCASALNPFSAAFAQPGQLLRPRAAIQNAGQQPEACPPRRARRHRHRSAPATSKSRSTSPSRTKPDATSSSPPSSSAASR